MTSKKLFFNITLLILVECTSNTISAQDYALVSRSLWKCHDFGIKVTMSDDGAFGYDKNLLCVCNDKVFIPIGNNIYLDKKNLNEALGQEFFPINGNGARMVSIKDIQGKPCFSEAIVVPTKENMETLQSAVGEIKEKDFPNQKKALELYITEQLKDIKAGSIEADLMEILSDPKRKEKLLLLIAPDIVELRDRIKALENAQTPKNK